MKKYALKAVFILPLLFPLYSNAQTTWETSGNTGASGQWIGTNNAFPFVIRTNNTEWASFSTAGLFKLNGLAGTGNGLMLVNSSGEVSRYSFTGTATQVLTGAGSFTGLGQLVGWGVPSTGITATANKVGIGIAAPVQALEVSGNILATGYVVAEQFIVSDIAKVGGTMTMNNNMIMNGYDPVTGLRNELYTINQPYYLQSDPYYNLNTIINYGNTGKVGIGTNNPLAKMHIVGNTIINGLLSADSLKVKGFRFQYIQGPDSLGVLNIMSTEGDAGSSGEDPMPVPSCIHPDIPFIHSINGMYSSWNYVGSHPTTMLSGVSGSDGIIEVAGPTARLIVNNNCAKDVLINTGTTSGNIYMTNATSGKIGFGTTSPLGDFELLKTNGLNAYFTTTTSTPARIHIGNNILGYTFGVDSSGQGQITDGTTPLISFMHGGVGIGTTCLPYSNPYKLNVNGLIVCEGIKVDLSDGGGCWPDYVFAQDYKLMPLNELEQYLVKNKHLPNIPSAEEVEIKGMNLEENDKMFLKKIEELTLYILQQQKQIEGLTKEIEALKIK